MSTPTERGPATEPHGRGFTSSRTVLFELVANQRALPFLGRGKHELALLVPFGCYYRWRVRTWPAADRVGALSFVPQSLVMPVMYALLTPLALFTLDSTRWETRT